MQSSNDPRIQNRSKSKDSLKRMLKMQMGTNTIGQINSLEQVLVNRICEGKAKQKGILKKLFQKQKLPEMEKRSFFYSETVEIGSVDKFFYIYELAKAEKHNINRSDFHEALVQKNTKILDIQQGGQIGKSKLQISSNGKRKIMHTSVEGKQIIHHVTPHSEVQSPLIEKRDTRKNIFLRDHYQHTEPEVFNKTDYKSHRSDKFSPTTSPTNNVSRNINQPHQSVPLLNYTSRQSITEVDNKINTSFMRHRFDTERLLNILLIEDDSKKKKNRVIVSRPTSSRKNILDFSDKLDSSKTACQSDTPKKAQNQQDEMDINQIVKQNEEQSEGDSSVEGENITHSLNRKYKSIDDSTVCSNQNQQKHISQKRQNENEINFHPQQQLGKTLSQSTKNFFKMLSQMKKTNNHCVTKFESPSPTEFIEPDRQLIEAENHSKFKNEQDSKIMQFNVKNNHDFQMSPLNSIQQNEQIPNSQNQSTKFVLIQNHLNKHLHHKLKRASTTLSPSHQQFTMKSADYFLENHESLGREEEIQIGEKKRRKLIGNIFRSGKTLDTVLSCKIDFAIKKKKQNILKESKEAQLSSSRDLTERDLSDFKIDQQKMSETNEKRNLMNKACSQKTAERTKNTLSSFAPKTIDQNTNKSQEKRPFLIVSQLNDENLLAKQDNAIANIQKNINKNLNKISSLLCEGITPKFSKTNQQSSFLAERPSSSEKERKYTTRAKICKQFGISRKFEIQNILNQASKKQIKLSFGNNTLPTSRKSSCLWP